MFHKVRDIFRAEGVSGLTRRVRAEGVSGLACRTIAYAYRRGVRPCIPGKPIRYAGIPICHDRKWGDRFVPITWLADDARADQPGYEATLDEPGYEAALVAGLSEIV